MPKVPGQALPFPGAPKVDDNVMAMATADFIGGIRRGTQTKVPVYKDPVEDVSFLSKTERDKLDTIGLGDLSELTRAPVERRFIYGDNE